MNKFAQFYVEELQKSAGNPLQALIRGIVSGVKKDSSNFGGRYLKGIIESISHPFKGTAKGVTGLGSSLSRNLERAGLNAEIGAAKLEKDLLKQEQEGILKALTPDPIVAADGTIRQVKPTSPTNFWNDMGHNAQQEQKITKAIKDLINQKNLTARYQYGNQSLAESLGRLTPISALAGSAGLGAAGVSALD